MHTQAHSWQVVQVLQAMQFWMSLLNLASDYVLLPGEQETGFDLAMP
jgi:hypothetical protein